MLFACRFDPWMLKSVSEGSKRNRIDMLSKIQIPYLYMLTAYVRYLLTTEGSGNFIYSGATQ